MKDGDIFSWRYTDEAEAAIREWRDPYWCKSRMAVCKDGILRDTYWPGSSDGAIEQDRVILTLLGNAKEMKSIGDGEKNFYRHEDIVDMNHPNNSRAPIYVKVGAVRDQQTMTEYFRYQVEKSERDIQWSKRRVKECQEYLARIERGETEGSFATYD